MSAPHLLDGRLKVRHLTLVVAVAEAGTMGRAADRLGVTQPVVTRGLQELEAVLGARVFERGPRGVRATPVGEVFIDHARSVVAQLGAAAQRVHEVSSGEVGQVVVGAHLAGSNRLLPEAVGQFKRRQPRAGVVIREGTPDLLADELRAGALDLTVGRIGPSGDPDVESVALYREPIRVVVSTGHPAARLRAPTLAQLVEHPWILPVAQTSLRGELESAFERGGVPLPANRVECTSILTLRWLIVTSGYVGVLPELIARDDPQLRVLSTPLEGVSRTVGMTTRAAATASPVAAAFMAVLSDVARGIRGSLASPSGRRS